MHPVFLNLVYCQCLICIVHDAVACVCLPKKQQYCCTGNTKEELAHIALTFGLQCPTCATLLQQSRYSLPSSSYRYCPLPRAMYRGSSNDKAEFGPINAALLMATWVGLSRVLCNRHIVHSRQGRHKPRVMPATQQIVCRLCWYHAQVPVTSWN